MSSKRLIVVGNGMAGMDCVDEILKRKPDFKIIVYSEEPFYNYNRILLSSVLAGEKSVEDIYINTEEWYRKNNITLHLGRKVLDRLSSDISSIGEIEESPRLEGRFINMVIRAK